MDNKRQSLNLQSWLAISLVMVIGSVAFIGWLTDHAALATFLPGIHRMSFNTSSCFLMIALALILPSLIGGKASKVQVALGTIVATLGLLVLLEDLANMNFGIDQLIIDQSEAYHDSPHPGRMSPLTSLSFLLSGVVAVWLGRSTTAAQSQIIFPGIIIIIAVLSILNLTMQSLFPDLPKDIVHFTSMSRFTSIGFLMISVVLWTRYRQQERYHQTILQAGINLMQRLNYSQKILLIAIILMVPFIYASRFMAIEVYNNINKTELEKVGLEYISSLSGFLELLAQHRGITNAYLSGDRSFEQTIILKRVEMDRRAKLSNAVVQKFRKEIGFEKEWQIILQTWAALRDNSMLISSSESWDRHTKLIARIIELNRKAYFKSNLFLDNEDASRHLIEVTFDHLPLKIEFIGQMRGKGSGFIIDRKISKQEGLVLTTYIANIKTHQEAIVDHVNYSLSSEKTTEVAFNKPLIEENLLTVSYLNLVKNLLVNPSINITPADYFDLGTQSISANYELMKSIISHLDSNLQRRTQEQRAYAYFLTMLSLLSGIVTIYLVFSFYQSIRQTAHKLSRVAEYLSEGSADPDMIIENQDELGEIVNTFNTLAIELIEKNSLISSIMENSQEGIVTIDSVGTIVSVNLAMEGLFGISSSDMIGKNIMMIVPERHRHAHLQGMERYLEDGKSSEMMGRPLKMEGLHADGREFPVELTITEIRWKEKVHFFGILRDITERIRSEEKLKHLATTDELTGTLNRRSIYMNAKQGLAQAKRHDRFLCLLMIDIDHFKQINDTYGHHAGDEALKAIVGICQSTIRDADLLGRWGGEEFVILLPDTELKPAQLLAERLRLAVEESGVILTGKKTPLTISIGVAQFDRKEDFDSLIQRADKALYVAKDSGRNRVELA
ncbi:MAG: diguanylate cyclase [Mariprofundaceae bacterium]